MTASSAKAQPNSTETVLKTGETAPDFTLPDNNGNEFSLAAQRGKYVVLYFYPKDDTPGCTVEAKEFRDHYDAFRKAGAEVVGISKDSVAKHDKFKCKYELTFPLISDEKGDMCERYGVWVEKSMYGKRYFGIQRATFLVGPDGKIAHIWPKVKPEGHALEVLDTLKKLA